MAGHPFVPFFSRAWRSTAGMLVILLVLSFASGCVQRRMMIRTDPPGAMAYVDDYPIGPTPIGVDFTYYGTRKIRLVKDGYETLEVMQPIPAPWYQIPPIDFVSENLMPGELRDHRVLSYQLRPQMVVPPEQLMGRAEELRQQARAAAPAPPLSPPPMGTAPSAPPSGAAPGAFGPTYPVSPRTPLPSGTGGAPVYPLPDAR